MRQTLALPFLVFGSIAWAADQAGAGPGAAAQSGGGPGEAVITGAGRQIETRTQALAAGALEAHAEELVAIMAADIRISRERITTGVRLMSTTGAAEATALRFVLPDLDPGSRWDAPEGFRPAEPPVAAHPNFVGLEVTANGTPVALRPEVAVRHIEDARDIGPDLEAVGMPVTDLAPADRERIAALPMETKLALARQRLIRLQTAQGGRPERLSPMWVVSTALEWDQPLPTEEPVDLVWSFSPFLGRGSVVPADLDLSEGAWHAARVWCLEREDHNGGRANQAIAELFNEAHARRGEPRLDLTLLNYSVAPGLLAIGPIPEVVLEIDTGNPEALVLACAEGLARTSPTTWSVTWTDRTPDNLALMFLEVPAAR